MEHTLKYELTRKDYANFNFWLMMRLMILTGGCLFIFRIFRLVSKGNVTLNSLFSFEFAKLILIVLGFFVFAVVFMYFFIQLRSGSIFKKECKSGNNNVCLVIDDTSVSEITGKDSIKILWEGLDSIVKTKKYIYFVFRKTKAIILPREHVNNEIIDFINSRRKFFFLPF